MLEVTLYGTNQPLQNQRNLEEIYLRCHPYLSPKHFELTYGWDPKIR
jgi:hypothetical protein